MAPRTDALLLWTPRVAGILLCLFLGLFALDTFGEGKTVVQALPDFLIHLTPMLFLLAVVAVSWRWEWVGAVAFIGLAVAYAYMARRNPTWVLGIAVPPPARWAAVPAELDAPAHVSEDAGRRLSYSRRP